jgi:hypothetical protein
MSNYLVRVVDSFHYTDETEVYTQSEYPSWPQAGVQAQRIVDESLAELHQPGMSATYLHFRYILLSADPFITPEPECWWGGIVAYATSMVKRRWCAYSVSRERKGGRDGRCQI